MDTQQTLPELSDPKNPIARALQDALESKQHRKRPYTEYRSFIQHHYDGLAGRLTAVTGLVTGHEALAGRLIRPGAFDVRGCKRILDAACGNGRYTRFILRHADSDAMVTAFDYSQGMLNRARKRPGWRCSHGQRKRPRRSKKPRGRGCKDWWRQYESGGPIPKNANRQWFSAGVS